LVRVVVDWAVRFALQLRRDVLHRARQTIGFAIVRIDADGADGDLGRAILGDEARTGWTRITIADDDHMLLFRVAVLQALARRRATQRDGHRLFEARHIADVHRLGGSDGFGAVALGGERKIPLAAAAVPAEANDADFVHRAERF